MRRCSRLAPLKQAAAARARRGARAAQALAGALPRAAGRSLPRRAQGGGRQPRQQRPHRPLSRGGARDSAGRPRRRVAVARAHPRPGRVLRLAPRRGRQAARQHRDCVRVRPPGVRLAERRGALALESRERASALPRRDGVLPPRLLGHLQLQLQGPKDDGRDLHLRDQHARRCRPCVRCASAARARTLREAGLARRAAAVGAAAGEGGGRRAALRRCPRRPSATLRDGRGR
mmetsp:Transcript_27520/g.91514  ORF Transcript_27520/g.91514 Transcript_27520/m.91514 type:complete len:232 (-) Transcript_27520:139-834(-)